MLQKKDTAKIPATPTTIKKPIVENQTSGKTKINVTKEGVPKIPATPTTIKKPIIENQTSGKTKINATKEGYQQHLQKLMLQKKIPAKIPATPTKTNVTKEGVPATYNKRYQQQQRYQ